MTARVVPPFVAIALEAKRERARRLIASRPQLRASVNWQDSAKSVISTLGTREQILRGEGFERRLSREDLDAEKKAVDD